MKSLILLATLATLPLHAEERVLFAFDEHNIAWQHNLKLTLVAPDKHSANPVVRCGPKGSPDYGHAILYGTVLHDGRKFRMWYLGMIQRELERGQAPGWWRPMCYAESTDGIVWTKPELGLVDLGGNKQNNICLLEGEVHSMTRVNDFLSVMHDPEERDPARRFKVAYIAHMPYDDIRGGMSRVGVKESRVGAMITATSADGLRWKIVGDRPANAGGERFEVSSLYRFGKFYHASGQLASPWCWLNDGRPAGRVMMTYRSPDFRSWSQAKALSMVLPQQQTDPQPTVNEMLQGFSKQMHMGVGVWNRGNVLVGLQGIWQAQPAGTKGHDGLKIDLGLAISNDGVHFREPVPNFKFLEHGRDGEWDSIALLQGHAFVNVGEKTYIWYSHWDCEGKFRSQEIGLATLRRDGFGHLSRKQDDNDAHFITSTFTAGKASINVDGITPEAPLTVQLLDPLDQPIAGCTATITQNGTRLPIQWSKKVPSGRSVALRLNFPANSRAKVYAVYLNN
ncbi:MAG: hypothetical protein HZA92_13015 [Verrucomicrobia bacterium]|nr:hypothetical protein [Verrucomicrobiota bacterium]